MDGSGAQYNPRTVDEVFRDFKGRRIAIIKALTTDIEEFYRQCDPEMESLCLYGFPSESWQVELPAEEVPANLPEPTLGINFARDLLQEKDWLSLVAVHSDAWLLSVASFFAGRFRFDKAGRERLFTLINDLPTIFEVLTGTAEEQADEKLSVLNLNSSKSKSGTEGGFESGEDSEEAKDEDEDEGLYEEDSEDYRDPLCGICGEDDGSTPDDEFFCDTCEKYYHFKCVNSEKHSCKGRTHKASISAPHAAISP